MDNLAKALDAVTKGLNDIDTVVEEQGAGGLAGNMTVVDTAIQDVISAIDESDNALASGADASTGLGDFATAENEVSAALESLTDRSSTQLTGDLGTINSENGRSYCSR